MEGVCNPISKDNRSVVYIANITKDQILNITDLIFLCS